jgi:hypothetical protein
MIMHSFCLTIIHYLLRDQEEYEKKLRELVHKCLVFMKSEVPTTVLQTDDFYAFKMPDIAILNSTNMLNNPPISVRKNKNIEFN